MAIWVECDDCGDQLRLTHFSTPTGWTGLFGSQQMSGTGRHRCKDCHAAMNAASDEALEKRRLLRNGRRLEKSIEVQA